MGETDPRSPGEEVGRGGTEPRPGKIRRRSSDRRSGMTTPPRLRSKAGREARESCDEKSVHSLGSVLRSCVSIREEDSGKRDLNLIVSSSGYHNPPCTGHKDVYRGFLLRESEEFKLGKYRSSTPCRIFGVLATSMWRKRSGRVRLVAGRNFTPPREGTTNQEPESPECLCLAQCKFVRQWVHVCVTSLSVKYYSFYFLYLSRSLR